ncbi:MAG: cell wall-active antibiotics response protein [Actinomycetota bacterium]|nr:cell wall-active antibiotics response protein [Actinomycetota bacterium]
MDFADTSASTTVHIGAGNVYVLVPANVDVTVHGTTGIGHLRLFDRTFNGGRDRTVTDLGADGAGGGTLQLYADTAIGDLEVSRD